MRVIRSLAPPVCQ